MDRRTFVVSGVALTGGAIAPSTAVAAPPAPPSAPRGRHARGPGRALPAESRAVQQLDDNGTADHLWRLR